uniref:Uncharacterized protein n=1 Tax=Schistocephalus solidus TaxID=70667 RepID=A0A0X3P899_SCHSO
MPQFPPNCAYTGNSSGYSSFAVVSAGLHVSKVRVKQKSGLWNFLYSSLHNLLPNLSVAKCSANPTLRYAQKLYFWLCLKKSCCYCFLTYFADRRNSCPAPFSTLYFCVISPRADGWISLRTAHTFLSVSPGTPRQPVLIICHQTKTPLFFAFLYCVCSVL